MALIIVLSAFNGLSNLVHSLYNSFNSDIQITLAEGKTFDANAPELQSTKKLNSVVYYNEIIEENVLLKYNEQQCLATLKGVSEGYEKMNGFDSLVNEGRFMLKNKEQNYTVIGKGISYVLNIGPGERTSPIAIYAPKKGITASVNPEDAFNKKNVYLSGVFSVNDEFDSKYILVPIAIAKELMDYTTEITSVELGLAPNADKDKIQAQLKQLLGPKYRVKNRYEQNELLYKTLKSEKLWTGIILVFIMVIATFNVIGSLTMLIIEKKKDIHTLWNLGASRGLIRKIFLIEGVLITLVGTISGIVLGALICIIQTKFGIIKFGDNYVVEAYPIQMQLLDFVVVFSIVMFIGIIAAWYPVRVFTRKQLV